MAGLPDVVRHIILRIRVDADSLAGELAAARAALNSLKDSEKKTNDERGKSHEAVDKAIKGQKQSAEDAGKAAEASGKKQKDAADATTASLDKQAAARGRNAKATQSQAEADARAENIRKNADAEFIAQQKLRQQFADDAAKRNQKAFEQEQARQAAGFDKFNERERQRYEKHEERERKRFEKERERDRQRAEREAAAFVASEARKASNDYQRVFNKQRADEQAYQSRQGQYDDQQARRSSTYGARLSDDFDSIKQGQQQRRSQTTQQAAYADTAVTNSANAANRLSEESSQRRIRTLREEHRLKEDIRKADDAGRIAEQRILDVMERRTRAAAREEEFARRRAERERRSQTLFGAAGNALADVATFAVRAGTTGRRAAQRATAADVRDPEEQIRRTTTTLGRIEKVYDDLTKKVGSNRAFAKFSEFAAQDFARVERAGDKAFTNLRRRTTEAATNSRAFNFGPVISGLVGLDRGVERTHRGFTSFFRSIPRGADDSSRSLSTLSAKFRAFVSDLDRKRGGEGGGGLIKDFIANFDTMGNRMAAALSKVSRHFLSFQTLILAVIAALGPLAAILGAVGAAALGVASNLAALAGVLYAVPGLISAAVSAFGALAIVMGPVTSAFSAFSAAQKEGAANSKAAAEAALALKDALLTEERASLAVERAKADIPRAKEAESKARRQATRDLEDYTLALKKQRYEEEGARLGVQSAEQEYRRALADPTQNTLGRDIAKHNVEGAKFDQRDQKVAAGRLREDAQEAFAKGVDGADAVVDAVRRAEDATYDLRDAEIAYSKAVIAVDKAKLIDAAGGEAAKKYQDELKKLPPQTRKVVEAIIGLNKEFGNLRDRLSEKIFGPLADDTGKFAGFLDILSNYLGPAADAIGLFADKALALFTNPEWKAFFNQQGSANGKIISDLGDAFLLVADAVREIMTIVDESGFMDFITEGIKGAAADFKKLVSSDEGKTGITKFLTTVMRTMRELKPVVGDILVGLGGFFNALNMVDSSGKSFTTWFNEGLQKGAKAFRELGEKAQDPRGGFQKWLTDVRPLLSQIVTFVGQVGKFFGELFSDTDNINEARDVLKEIGERWLPALAAIFEKLSQSGFISKLARTVGSVLEGIQKLFDSGAITGFMNGLLGVFTTVSDAFSNVTGWIDYLTKAVPGVGVVLTGLATLIGVLFGAALIAKLLRVVRIFTGIGSFISGTKSLFADARNLDDDDPKKPSKKQSFRDNLKDKLLPGRETGESAARREAREKAKAEAEEARKNGTDGKPGQPGSAATPGAPKVDRTGTGGILPHLSRMERILGQIRDCVCRLAAGAGGGRDRDRGTRPARPGRYGLPSAEGTRVQQYDPGFRDSNRPRPSTEVDTRGSNWRYIPGTGQQYPFEQRPELNRPPRVGDPGSRPSPMWDGPRPLPGSSQRELSDRAYQIPAREMPPGPVPPKKPRRTSQFPSGPARPPAAPMLPDAGDRPANYSDRIMNYPRNVYPGLDDNYDVPEAGGTYGRGKYTESGVGSGFGINRKNRRFLADLPDSPMTSLPWVGDDRTPYEEKTPVRRTSQYPGGPRRPPLAPNLADVGTPDDSRYITEPKPKRPVQQRLPNGRFGPKVTPIALPSTAYPSLEAVPVPGSMSPEPRRPSRRDRTTVIESDVVDPVDTTDAFGRRGRPIDPAIVDSALRTDRPLYGDLPPRDSIRGGQPATSATPGTAPRRNLFGRIADRLNRPGNVFGPDPDVPSQPGRFSRFKDRFRDVTSNDQSGSAQIAPGRGEGFLGFGRNRPSRDENTTRVRTRVGGRGRGRGLLGGLANLFGGAAESGISEVLQGDVLDNDQYEDIRRRRSMGVDDDGDDAGGRRRGLPEGDSGRGAVERGGRGAGRGGRFGSIVKGLGGKAGRIGGGLARGLAGGLVGAALSGVASIGGDYLINKFVKNDKDAGSLSRGVGAVSTGAGIGATIGSIIPGVGTVVGGAIGGLAGGAYSLFKDKNLRNFVGGKISGAAQGVGNFFGGVGDKIGNFFGGGKDDGGKGGGIGDKLKGALAGLAGGGIVGALLGGTDIGKSILDSLKKAGKGIGDFFTKDIPRWFNNGIKSITNFFTKTLPSLPGKAFDAITYGLGRVVRFFAEDIPRAASAAWAGITTFFTETLPNAASAAWAGITTFFTETLPNAASAAWNGIVNFLTETIPNAASALWDMISKFFTETLPNAASTAWNGITNFFTKTLPDVFNTVVDTITTFFSETLPNFFTKTLPDAIGKVPGMVKAAIVDPVVEFFGGIGDALKSGWNGVKNWASDVFNRGKENYDKGRAGDPKMMSGGLVEGIYQGIQDTAKIYATPGEFMVRKSKVDEPGAKAFLRTFNEQGMSSLYAGLSASAAPNVMSMVPPDAQSLTGSVPTVVNNTVNHAPLMGDVTINNPHRETSDTSLRRQVQIAAIRHRR